MNTTLPEIRVIAEDRHLLTIKDENFTFENIFGIEDVIWNSIYGEYMENIPRNNINNEIYDIIKMLKMTKDPELANKFLEEYSEGSTIQMILWLSLQPNIKELLEIVWY